jgi:hypothetical protein
MDVELRWRDAGIGSNTFLLGQPGKKRFLLARCGMID